MKYMIFSLGLLWACGNPHTTEETTKLFHGDAGRNLVYDDDSVRSISGISWTFPTGNVVRATPLVVDGIAYIGSADSNFYALNANDGTPVWTFKGGAPFTGSAAISGEHLYVGDRANTVYALSKRTGGQIWSVNLGKTLPYPWVFDYYVSSPLLEGSTLYIGTGSGFVYALDAASGKEKWKFKTGAIVRSSPAMANGMIYVGDFSGKLYALDAISGRPRWTFKTKGSGDDNEHFGFDRRAIVGAPAITGDRVLVGARDGFLYCLDAHSGQERWHYDYNQSWIIGTPSVKDSIVVVATSSNQFIQALDLNTGRELWRKPTAYLFASPFIAGDEAVDCDAQGTFYFLDLKTGKETGRFHLTDFTVFSSPVLADGKIFIGSDDGKVYALKSSDKITDSVAMSRRAVYYVKAPFKNIDIDPFGNVTGAMDVRIRDYFSRQGYTVLNDSSLKAFLSRETKDSLPSVVVFATNFFPASVYDTAHPDNLLVQYLHAGGKVVVTGLNPGGYKLDKGGNLSDIDVFAAGKILGIGYKENDTRMVCPMPSTPTIQGREWGWTTPCLAYTGADSSAVSEVLATNEYGRAVCWVKRYTSRPGTGFVQLCLLPGYGTALLEDVQRVTEYGL